MYGSLTKGMEGFTMKIIDGLSAGKTDRNRKRLIGAVERIWDSDSEMIYLILWMWASDEASQLVSPEESKHLLEMAEAGSGTGVSGVLRRRLWELHDHVNPGLRAAA